MAEWLTLSEVARELGMGRTQAWRLVKKGRLPAQRNGRHWMVSRANVERIKVYRENLKSMLSLPFGKRTVEKSGVG